MSNFDLIFLTEKQFQLRMVQNSETGMPIYVLYMYNSSQNTQSGGLQLDFTAVFHQNYGLLASNKPLNAY